MFLDAIRGRVEFVTLETAKFDAGVALFTFILIFAFAVTVFCIREGDFAFGTLNFYLQQIICGIKRPMNF